MATDSRRLAENVRFCTSFWTCGPTFGSHRTSSFSLRSQTCFPPDPLCCALSFCLSLPLPRTRPSYAGIVPSLMFFFVVFAAVCCLLLPVMVAIVLLPFLHFATLVVASVDDGESFCLRLSSIAIPFSHLCCIGISSSSSLFLSVSLSLCLLVSHPSHTSLSFSLFLTSYFLVYYVVHFFPPPSDRLSRRPYPMLDSRYFFSIMRYHGKVALLIQVDPTHMINDQ